MRSFKTLLVVPILGLLAAAAACSKAEAPIDEKPRYRVTTDRRGNTFRLDTFTGEVTRTAPEAPRAKTSAKPGAPRQKHIAQAADEGATPVHGSEQPDASARSEATDETPAPTPPSTSVAELSRAVANLSAGGGCGADARRAFVVLRNTDAFLKADASTLRLATIAAGVRVNGIAAEGEWRMIRFTDARWGERAAYVRCSVLELAPSSASALNGNAPASHVDVPVRRERTPNLTVAPGQKRETLRGYVEWQKGTYVVVDGERVRWTAGTRMDVGRLPFISSVPAGYEMVAVGRRTRDGSLLAERIDAKPNATATHEREVAQQFDEIERAWLASGTMFVANGNELKTLGRLEETGTNVDRVRRVMKRIVPPYVDAARIRVHVVDSDEWNARAMANGAVWVNTGLLNDISDDELAVVLGHELAHYTYEHARRSATNDTWRQLAAVGATGALSGAKRRTAHDTILIAAKLSLLAWGNAYTRNLEDQADRVGLRYAYEGGFDVGCAIDLWSRARSRFGEDGVVSNWFSGDHSRPTDRINNIRRELQLNY